MSWLVDLAGKAESLLEKVDQTAASALQSGSDITPGSVNTAPSQHTYVPGIEKTRGRDGEKTTAGKSISKTNATNSKYYLIQTHLYRLLHRDG